MTYSETLSWLKEDQERRATHPNFLYNITIGWDGEEIVLYYKKDFNSYDRTAKLSRLTAQFSKVTH